MLGSEYKKFKAFIRLDEFMAGEMDDAAVEIMASCIATTLRGGIREMLKGLREQKKS